VHQLIHKSLSGVNLAPNVVTVSLRSPSHSVPIQQWHFTDQPIIKIGRCADNHIVLRSSVVSRYHLELRRMGNRWKLINFGNNGTYKGGQPITELEIQNETIIRLALSGPQLQINLSATVPEPLLKLLRHHDSGTGNQPLPGRLRTMLSGS
jgi:pSer/pThr/pTyr-binding forkhead associated (FHA) protein